MVQIHVTKPSASSAFELLPNLSDAELAEEAERRLFQQRCRMFIHLYEDDYLDVHGLRNIDEQWLMRTDEGVIHCFHIPGNKDEVFRRDGVAFHPHQHANTATLVAELLEDKAFDDPNDNAAYAQRWFKMDILPLSFQPELYELLNEWGIVLPSSPR